MLSDGVRDCEKLKYFIVDVEGNSLIVYLPDGRVQAAQAIVESIAGKMGFPFPLERTFGKEIITRSRYSPMMRFTLTDFDNRLFSLERWSSLGSIRRLVFSRRANSVADPHREICKSSRSRKLYDLI